MNKKKFKFKTAKEYVDFLTKASEIYYAKEESEDNLVDDEEFDLIKDEFEKRFPEHDYLKEVGAKISEQSTFAKVAHSIKMGSQAKINTLEELKDWIDKSESKINKKITSFIASEKIDGFSLSLEYQEEINQALTRGDGIIGEDVTVNVKKMKNVPHKIASNKKITIRGEAVIFLDDFKNHFADKKNPRNAAAGTVRRLDGDKCEFLTFLAYDILIDGQDSLNDLEKFKMLESLGFKTPVWKECKSLEEVQSYWKEYNEGLRIAQKYEMDGLVVVINDLESQKILGIIDQRPRYSRAYKFTAQYGESKIIAIDYFAGRTGRITPVAKIEPLNLAGVTIQNVTLHNISEMNRLKIRIGVSVKLKRAGDVIPKIESVTKDPNSSQFKLTLPENCPSCGQPTTIEDKFLMCYNKNCEAKHYENLLHWVKTLEIKGFGEELVNQLNEAGLLSSPADFYKLSINDIASLDRRGEKSATKVLEELHKKTTISYPIFIKALGIINFSDKTAEMVQPYFPTIDSLFNAKFENLVEIHGVGDIVAQAIVEGLKSKKILIESLLKNITIKDFIPPVSTGKLSGKSFCFTGVRDKDLENKIQSLGGSILSGVSKNLTYLVAKEPESTSSKLQKARDLGVTILSLSQAKEIVDLTI